MLLLPAWFPSSPCMHQYQASVPTDSSVACERVLVYRLTFNEIIIRIEYKKQTDIECVRTCNLINTH